MGAIIETLPTAEITVAFVNEPKEGKKNGSIKAADGQYYSVPPHMLPQFAKGMRCRVEYKPFGDTGRAIQKVIGNTNMTPTVPKNDYRARSNPAEAKQIAVLALAKPLLEKLPREEVSEAKLVAVLELCMRAYDKTLGGMQAQRRDDMDDEIPH